MNSTLAVALTSAKMNISVAHVEAGLRSFDRTMPEEINRTVTDYLAELLFTTEKSANENLHREGIPEERIHFVANCMVDTLLKHVEYAVSLAPWRQFGVRPGEYAVLTLHRPSNVDNEMTLRSLMSTINEISSQIPILFPVHPRTRSSIERYRIHIAPSVTLLPPLSYVEFIGLVAKARLVMTDSGGIQEESTVLGIPCLTLRWNTERPVTLTMGTNRLVGTDPNRIKSAVKSKG